MSTPGEPSKVSAKMDEVKGSVKSATGGLIGNKNMQAQGEAEKASGTAQMDAATAKQHMDATTEKGKGTMDKVIGTVTGDKTRQTQGDTHKAKGDIMHRAA